jgi:hypothetical protein
MSEEAPVRGITSVVYIEADHANALLMQCLLASKTDYALHHAANGHSGLKLCRQVRPDLVITESHLPDMNGYDILRALRDGDATACVPCIVLSGAALPSDIERALAAGFDGYWTKPIDIWQLLLKIKAAIANVHRKSCLQP